MAHINKCIEDLLRKSECSRYRAPEPLLLRTNSMYMRWFIFGRRKKAGRTPCSRMGARQRSKYLYALQKDSIHNDYSKGKSSIIYNMLKIRNKQNSPIPVIAASLPELWSSRLWAMLIEEIFVTTTKLEASTRMPRLLWFIKPIEKWTGE